MSIKTPSKFACHVRGQKLRNKAALRPWVVAPISMAATPGAFDGGRRLRCSCVVDPHHDRRGEHRPSFPSFPLIEPFYSSLRGPSYRVAND